MFPTIVFLELRNRFESPLTQQQRVAQLFLLLQHQPQRHQPKKIFVGIQRYQPSLLLHLYVLKQYLLVYRPMLLSLIVECFHDYLFFQLDQTLFRLHRFVKSILLLRYESLLKQQLHIFQVNHKPL